MFGLISKNNLYLLTILNLLINFNKKKNVKIKNSDN